MIVHATATRKGIIMSIQQGRLARGAGGLPLVNGRNVLSRIRVMEAAGWLERTDTGWAVTPQGKARLAMRCIMGSDCCR